MSKRAETVREYLARIASKGGRNGSSEAKRASALASWTPEARARRKANRELAEVKKQR